jgi:hypothetical protein
MLAIYNTVDYIRINIYITQHKNDTESIHRYTLIYTLLIILN